MRARAANGKFQRRVWWRHLLILIELERESERGSGGVNRRQLFWLPSVVQRATVLLDGYLSRACGIRKGGKAVREVVMWYIDQREFAWDANLKIYGRGGIGVSRLSDGTVERALMLLVGNKMRWGLNSRLNS